MPKRPYDAYGEMARALSDDTQIAGRYPVQRENERRILFDVAEKLDLQASDRCLEIGCGSGNLLIPLSFLVEEVVGVDHPDVLDRLRERAPIEENITLIDGDFPDVELDGEFDKILVYSVLHCLHDREEVKSFLEGAISLLAPGGRLLVGDIPNDDTKQRFVESSFGEIFLEKWSQRRKNSDEKSRLGEFMDETETVSFDDEFVLSLIADFRREDTNAYLRSQSVTLPFGHTREDIVVERLPKSEDA
jgi:cyclopropane fatty-acyl-phospholipid synthase-like methyltransferase